MSCHLHSKPLCCPARLRALGTPVLSVVARPKPPRSSVENRVAPFGSRVRPAGSVRSVPDRPYTLLSCAVSIDGYLDDASPDRLILSGPEDLDEIDVVLAQQLPELVSLARSTSNTPSNR